MKRLLLLLAMVALSALPLRGEPEMTGEMLAAGWDAFATTELEEPDGIFYFAYVLGVMQGTDANSTLLTHVPGFSMARMAMLVGHYIDKHRNEADFNKKPAANIVTAAVLEVYPSPKVAGQNM
jgi:hypothetical protein